MPLTVKEQLKKWEETLAQSGIECAFVESELIYCHAAEKRRGEIFFEQNQFCPEDVSAAGDEIVRRRIAREPLQYITGLAPFMDFELEVTPDVLIPRPETELLAEFVIKNLPRPGKLLDVGTGSGAIALSAAFARNDISVQAVDISPAALRVAKGNALRYKLADRVDFLQSDLLSNVDGTFDLIAANLPYVTEDEYTELEPEVKNHEPKLALTAPQEGLELIFRLIDTAPPHLKPGGIIILEHGHNHANAIARYLESSGMWQDIKIIKDYNDVERFTSAALK